MFLLAMAGWVAASPARGQGIDREYKLKAIYLYKFATYVQWPEGAFRDAASPFVIGILGPDPVGADLQRIAKVKKIDGRKIKIWNFKNAKQVRDCHILFISRAVESQAQTATLRQLSGRSILFVGEAPDFLDQGGSIRFVIRENRVQFLISKSAYDHEGLNVSAQLLRVAQVVP